MLLENLDWFDVYERFDAWEALAPSSRKAYVGLRASDRISGAAFGKDIETLAQAGLLLQSGALKFRVHPEIQPMARALCFMSRHPVLREHDRAALARYFVELLTQHERDQLRRPDDPYRINQDALALRVSSMEWPRDFAHAQPGDGDFPDPSLPSARRLVAALLETPGPLPLRDLPERLGDDPHLWDGVGLAVVNLAVFPAFLGEHDALSTPGLTLWPAAARRHFAPRPAAPAPVTPERTWSGASLVDDASTFLIATSTEPLLVRRNDLDIFARTARELEAGLTPVPEWVVRATSALDPDARIGTARRLLSELGLIEPRELPGGRIGLVSHPTAREWLGLGPARRFHDVLDYYRVLEGFGGPSGKDARGAPGDVDAEDPDDWDALHDWEGDDWEGEVDDDLRDPALWVREGRGWSRGVEPPRVWRSYTGRWYGYLGGQEIPTRVREAVGRVSGQGFVALEAFATHEASAHNPFGAEVLGRGYRSFGSIEGTDNLEARERAWANELRRFVLDRLVPLGGARLGSAGDALLFEPTPAGRYLVGLTDNLEMETVDERGAVVVQPNLEVVFLASAPETEAVVARFAERLGHGVGTLFRLTAEAAYAAAAAGLDADHALDTLAAASALPVPDNVRRELLGWFARARRLAVRRTLVVECPDAAVARRLAAAGGSQVRLLSDTVVEITGGKIDRRLSKRAAADGLFLDPPAKQG